MKSVDRKIVVLILFGVVLVAPFLMIASILGIHAATLAPNARPEVFCLLLATASRRQNTSGLALGASVAA